MSSKQDESRETPNFSLALSKRDIIDHDEEEDQATLVSSPDRIQHPPVPTEMNPPELIHIPTSIDVFEEINYPRRVETEKSMGTIVKN